MANKDDFKDLLKHSESVAKKLWDNKEDEIEEIEVFDVKTSQVVEKYENLTIYPANMFVTSQDVLQAAIWDIQQDLVKQVDYFKKQLDRILLSPFNKQSWSASFI